MVKSFNRAGNFNLKGKKEVLCSCLCCSVKNLVEREENKRINREILIIKRSCKKVKIF